MFAGWLRLLLFGGAAEAEPVLVCAAVYARPAYEGEVSATAAYEGTATASPAYSGTAFASTCCEDC